MTAGHYRPRWQGRKGPHHVVACPTGGPVEGEATSNTSCLGSKGSVLPGPGQLALCVTPEVSPRTLLFRLAMAFSFLDDVCRRGWHNRSPPYSRQLDTKSGETGSAAVGGR